MEACYLSSDLIIKSLPFCNSSKQISSFRSSRRQLRLTKYARVASSPSSSTPLRCQLGQSEESPNNVSGDWRSFRARLVALESLSLSPQETNPPSASPSPSPIVVGDKWAHPIYEPEKGCLLVATEKLDGVHIFERTVILILSTGPLGPAGVILNRPSLMSIKEARSSVFDVAGTFSERPLNFGGPLEEGLFLFLGGGDGNGNGNGNGNREGGGLFEEVIEGKLYYGTKESVGCAAEMVKRGVIEAQDFTFFDGYCGWEDHQLRDEIRAGYWDVVACSPSVIGLHSTSGLLREDIIGLISPRKVW